MVPFQGGRETDVAGVGGWLNNEDGEREFGLERLGALQKKKRETESEKYPSFFQLCSSLTSAVLNSDPNWSSKHNPWHSSAHRLEWHCVDPKIHVPDPLHSALTLAVRPSFCPSILPPMVDAKCPLPAKSWTPGTGTKRRCPSVSITQTDTRFQRPRALGMRGPLNCHGGQGVTCRRPSLSRPSSAPGPEKPGPLPPGLARVSP